MKARPTGLNTVEMLKIASRGLGIGPHHAMQVTARAHATAPTRGRPDQQRTLGRRAGASPASILVGWINGATMRARSPHALQMLPRGC